LHQSLRFGSTTETVHFLWTNINRSQSDSHNSHKKQNFLCLVQIKRHGQRASKTQSKGLELKQHMHTNVLNVLQEFVPGGVAGMRICNRKAVHELPK